VQLTFDDGWRGSVDVAGPLLAERGLQMLLFVTTGLTGRPHFLTTTELAHLPRDTFHVGSHTVTHPFLSELDDAEIADELRRSRCDLEDIVGYEIDSLSIPNGAADERVIRIAAEIGYRFVCVSSVYRNTAHRGPLAIGRVAIRCNTNAETVARYAGGNLNRERVRAALLSCPKRLLGAARYRRLRGILLGEPADAQEMCDLLCLNNAGCNVPVDRSVVTESRSSRIVSSGVKS
jgi:peptidoglycan/xylan/chitin deacetylase (PgdA/CDA1 family)